MVARRTGEGDVDEVGEEDSEVQTHRWKINKSRG